MKVGGKTWKHSGANVATNEGHVNGRSLSESGFNKAHQSPTFKLLAICFRRIALAPKKLHSRHKVCATSRKRFVNYETVYFVDIVVSALDIDKSRSHSLDPIL